MSPVQQQRVIGAILLVIIIAGIAYFFMSNASDKSLDTVHDTSNEQSVFHAESDVMPEGDIEVVQDDTEAFVELHTESTPKAELNLKPAIVAIEKPEPPKLEDTSPANTSSKSEKISSSNKQIDALDTLETALSKTVPKAEVAKTTNKSPVWVLQLASFSVYDNALKLDASLKDKGYRSFIDPVELDSGKTIYRVRIGPKSDKPELERLAKKLKHEFKLNTQILQKLP